MRLTSVLLGFALALVFASMPLPQDPVKAAPEAFKERLNNSEVLELEYSSKPGQVEALHSHSAAILYIIQGG